MKTIKTNYPIDYYNNNYYVPPSRAFINIDFTKENDSIEDEEELTFSEMLLEEKERERILHNELEE